jgi:hypothetical protein
MPAVLWAGAFALLWTMTPFVRWWHPYCDRQEDGPGYFAWGFPLPWGEPTGVSSLEFTWQPLALALDVLLMGAAFHLVFRWAMPRLYARRPARLRMVALLGGLMLLVMSAWFGLWLSQAGIASATLGAEGYRSYRPYRLAAAQGHRACAR